jgi:dethiobiotin synthetase
MSAKKIIFITGTDTGVGKTLFTALLLHHLRQTGVRALAMKPFCSGGLADVKLLQSLQPGELSDAEMNPFYFREPIAPLVAAQKNRRIIRLSEVLSCIKHVENKCDCLLIEGSGGLLVPLGKGFTVADLIGKLNCQVIVVARNRLGTINHTMLTVNVLQAFQKGPRELSIVLMAPKKPDFSFFSNQKALFALLKPIKILQIPFLGEKATRISRLKAKYPNVKKIFATLTTEKIASRAERIRK